MGAAEVVQAGEGGPECGWLQEPGTARAGCTLPSGHFGFHRVAPAVVLIVQAGEDWRVVGFGSAEEATAWKVANRQLLAFVPGHPGSLAGPGPGQYTALPIEGPAEVLADVVAEAVGTAGVAFIEWGRSHGELVTPEVAGRAVYLLDDRGYDVEDIGAGIPPTELVRALYDARTELGEDA